MDTDEKPYLMLSGRFEDIEFIGNSHTVLGVPFDAPDEFKRKVWAAAQCYISGNSSTDYFYKRYCQDVDFPRPNESRRKLSSLLRLCSYEIERVSGELSNGIERLSTLGLFASESALTRLSVSFEYAAFLLMQGATYESAATLRLCLEQIAWAYEVHSLDDDSLFQKNPVKSISKIKEIDPCAGRLYSLLSDYTHIHPKIQRGYLDFSGEFAAVLYRDYEKALQMGDIYVKIVDLYARTAEWISHKYFRSLRAWTINGENKPVGVSDYSSTTVMRDWLANHAGGA